MKSKMQTGATVFGLDIGTRSIVGTVGYKQGDLFVILAQRTLDHETRAMIDGQIHDIQMVAEKIRQVKELLEKDTGITLKRVSIAAAGRVLKTVSTKAQIKFTNDRIVTQDDLTALDSLGVENAYQEFQKETSTEESFYCVGYSVVRYYLGDNPISNLLNHKTGSIGEEIIATFLPNDVVDGLYQAVSLADLEVSNLTLEPIAAMELAIPQKFRMLNIALVDIGAGTSDISITKDGSIVAYGMIPSAGDRFTETIAKHCLVEFNVAEQIKRSCATEEVITYEDIMCLPQKITAEEVNRVLEEGMLALADSVANKICELNSEKAVSAVFVVGGGGKCKGFTEHLADRLGIARERVAIRGEEVMQHIQFPEGIKKDPELVTPIGICLHYYEQKNNFVFVTLNRKRVRLYESTKLSVIDAVLQANYSNEKLFPRRGKELRFTINAVERVVRAQAGDAARIYVNNQEADLQTLIKSEDTIRIVPSTKGSDAVARLGDLPECKQRMSIELQGVETTLPKRIFVNKKEMSMDYLLQDHDEIEVVSYYDLEGLSRLVDIPLSLCSNLMVNSVPLKEDSRIYEGFSITWSDLVLNHGQEAQEDWDTQDDREAQDDCDIQEEQPGQKDQKAQEFIDKAGKEKDNNQLGTEHATYITVNGSVVALKGKEKYVFVDVFDVIDFDLSSPKGNAIVTLNNGTKAEYMDILHEGDKLEIYWKE